MGQKTRGRKGRPLFQGVVKWFNDQKGYGFLTDPATGTDYIVHWSAIRKQKGMPMGRVVDEDGRTIEKVWRSLAEGQLVDVLEVEERDKGLAATEVVKLP